MTQEQILQKLQPIFRDVLDQPSLTIGPNDNASTVEGWDSLAHINLVTSIEQEFDIQFELGDLENVHTVGEMTVLMVKKLDGAA
jgi:acyl carrier protein